MDDGSKGRHEWVIEFSTAPSDWQKCCHLLDKRLREVNSDYDAKRYQDLALLAPLMHNVPSGTFYEWMGRRGKLGGQNKVPRLSNSREYLEGILQMVYQMK